MKILSLFSGAGGLDLGLKLSGHDIIWANDICEDAVKTYKHNIGNHIVCSDIKDINIRTLPHAEVVVGGFPCQGFSVANRRRNIEDERNVLYRFFYDTIKIIQPLYFIAENVKGILSLGKGTIINQIIKDFQDAGYIVEIHKVNMADYGVPQHRERVIIVGQRIDLGKDIRFDFPKETHSKDGKDGKKKWVTIKEAIENLPPVNSSNGDPNNVYSKYKVVFRNYTAHRPTDPNKPCPTILARGNGKGGVCANPHYNGERRLSIRECASIQTFPEDFIFYGSMGSCYRQIGNAVPVKFGQILGEALNKVR